MTTGAEQLVKDMTEATNSHDIDKLVSLFSDDCTFELFAAGIDCKGKEELRDFQKETYSAFPDFKVELKSSIVSGNQICGEYIMTGSYKGKLANMPVEPTGRNFSVPCVRVDELKDGKVYQSRVYYDGASFMQQIGVMPEPPQ